jgi:hypothetical protein
LGGLNQEDCGSRSPWTNSFQDPIFKITRTKWTRGVAEVTEHLLCKHKALSSNPSLTKIIIVIITTIKNPENGHLPEFTSDYSSSLW